MSGFRTEDNNSSSQSSSGLGTAGLVLAAGVGIGTAFYYLFNKIQGDHYEGEQAFRDRAGSIEQCSICFAALLRTERVTSLRCAHNFHSECISRWFLHIRTCPICRRVS